MLDTILITPAFRPVSQYFPMAATSPKARQIRPVHV